MPLERHVAGFLQGYEFHRNEQMPTLGLLRLKTDRGLLFLTVTKQSLIKLEQACRGCAEQLQE
jgi:hypothetical protein